MSMPLALVSLWGAFAGSACAQGIGVTPAASVEQMPWKDVAAIGVSSLIVLVGFLAFVIKRPGGPKCWREIDVQTLAVIFFFPTLIILGVYVQLEKSAITTILGAFLGYLFTRDQGTKPSSTGDEPKRPARTSKNGQSTGEAGRE